VRFDAAGRETFRQQHGLANKYVVMYSGNHSPVHPLDTLMTAAEQLQADVSIVFCFVGGGSEFKRVQRWAKAGKRTNVLCLPYQPLVQLSASLSAADAHVVVMGNAMLGLVHPCKIYNMLAVGAPVIYIGPQPSHVTEILERPGAEHPWCSVRHGEGILLAERIQELRLKVTERKTPAQFTATFAKDVLLPRMIAGLEKAD
jgi:glycosyltransferase involved in cell wall biosynthesis